MAEHDARAETPKDVHGDPRRERLGRLTFRAWRRGFREADLVLGPFMEAEGDALSDEELDTFEALLAEDDHDLYAWIIETKPTPAMHDTPFMSRLRTFMRAHVSAAVAQGAG